MCGIAGFWLPGLTRAEGEPLAAELSRRLRHRGPDGEGVTRVAGGGPVLVHRRLAIVDLSPAGRQPMVSASGRFTMVFNGEVYNHAELRGALEAGDAAPPWRGHSDTEVMLAAIEAWGLEAALARFVGMFAFALWDAEARALTLVRDRLGVKPLYVARLPGGVGFASELKALRALPGFDGEVDPAALGAYVAASCVPGTRTIHRGARRVAPGGWLRFDTPSAAPESHAWWSPARTVAEARAAPFQGTEDEAVEALDALLRDAVQLRMQADVPLGAFLSGGVDSSVVVALMQAQSSRPVHTFSIGNEVAAYDEADAAAAVARHLGTRHTSAVVTAAEAAALVPRLPAMFDEPFADSSQIPTQMVSALARAHVTVALSGDGGDELFGGYVRHTWAARSWPMQRRVPAAARRIVGTGLRAVPPGAWDRLFALAGPALPKVRLPGLRIHKLASALACDTVEALHGLLASHWRPEDGLLLQPLDAPGSDAPEAPAGLRASAAEWMMYRDLVAYLPDDVLTKVDRTSMSVSLEAREPLLDHRLLAFAWSLPLDWKIRGGTGKWILRRVLARYVPEQLGSGPKMGFGVPLGDWLRGPLRPWAEELLSERALRETGVFAAPVVRARWRQLQAGTHPWEHHLWDVLMYQGWAGSRE